MSTVVPYEVVLHESGDLILNTFAKTKCEKFIKSSEMRKKHFIPLRRKILKRIN